MGLGPCGAPRPEERTEPPQVPRQYCFPQAPMRFDGAVAAGFGRGSKELGFPTANLPPGGRISGPAASLPYGVYFGCAPWGRTLPAHLADSVSTGAPSEAE